MWTKYSFSWHCGIKLVISSLANIIRCICHSLSIKLCWIIIASVIVSIISPLCSFLFIHYFTSLFIVFSCWFFFCFQQHLAIQLQCYQGLTTISQRKFWHLYPWMPIVIICLWRSDKLIKRDALKHKTVKTSNRIQCFGVVITPLSRKI